MPNLLWGNGSLENHFEKLLRSATSAIVAWDSIELLNLSENDLLEYLYSEFLIEVPSLDVG